MKMQPLQKLVTIFFTSMVLLACEEPPTYKEFPQFEAFKAAVERGESINCEEVANTKITKETWNGGGSKSEYTHGVLSYAMIKGYTFDMCPNITNEIEKYCNGEASRIVNEVIGDNKLTPVFKEAVELCTPQLEKEIAEVNDTYNMPSDTSKFLELKSLGVLVKPEDITKIKYSNGILSIWRLTLFTPEENYHLYFGNKELLDKAKEDIVSVISIKQG